MSPEDEKHEPRAHRPRDAPHEQPLTRAELDEERWFEEQGDAMEARVHDVEHEIEDAERAAPGHPGPPVDEPG